MYIGRTLSNVRNNEECNINCLCIFYLIGGEVEKQKRVSQLSAMAAEARRLSALKCYDLNDASRSLEKINQDSAEETQDSSNNSEDQSPSKKKVKQR